MAQVSEFLRKKAYESAKKTSEQYGEDAYGGTKWREEQMGKTGSNVPAAAAKTETAKPEYARPVSFTAPSQQLYDAAEKEYNDYINSEEHKNLKLQNMAIRAAQMQPKNSASTYAASAQNPNLQVQEDTTEKELRAKRDYYKNMVNAENDSHVMESDLAELETWTEKDRADLDKYVGFRQTGITSGGYAVPAKEAYNNLVSKYGKEKVDQLAYTWQRDKNAKDAAALAERSASAVKGNTGAAIGHSAATIPANLLGSVAGAYGVAIDLATRDNRYSTLDPNNIGTMASVYSGAVRGQVAEDIAGDGSSDVRNALSVGYQGAMSAADSIARAAVTMGSPVGLGLAASSSFSQTVSEASKQGATPAQAIVLGVGNAAIEAATEKVPLDNMLKAAKGGVKGAKAIAKEALRQAAIEATEEEISLFGNLLWEAAVLQEKSSYKQSIAEAIANGMSYEQAKEQADKAIWEEALNTAAVSAVAGGLSGGGSAAFGSIFGGDTQTPVQTEQAAEVETPAQTEQPAQFVPEAAPKTKEQVIAEDLANRIAGKKEPAQPETAVQDESTVVNTDPAEHTPQEKKIIDEYQGAVDNENKNGQKETASSLSGDAEASRFTSDNATKSDAVLTNIVPEDVAEVKGTGAAEQNKSVGGMASNFKHEVKRSKIYENTYANSPNADVRLIGREAERQDPNIGQYDVITEKESLHEAELRTETGRDRYSEYRYLIGKDGWTGADNDTASRLLDIYRREKKTEMFTALAKKQREMGTQAGQMIQSFAKYSRANATDAAADAILDLDKLTIDQIDTTFWNPKNEAKSTPEKKNALQKWKESVSTSLLEVADDIDHVADGDSDAMRAIVRQIANLRHTTAMAGYSSELTKRTERGLAKMDFETLKTVAKTQLSMIPNDFRKRSAGEIVKQIRMQNMLFTLTTKFKNDTGNISNGIMDSVSDSFGGRAMDVLLSKYTGKRTVANDTRYAAQYLKAARDAADVAAAFVSLDIPMESDAKYAAGRTRTWSPNTTNTLARLMSAYEKHMKYALEVSDKFYEGGAAHVVSKSLESLGEKSGLTAEEIKSLAEKTGARRTFKDPGVESVGKDGRPKTGRVGARVASSIQRGLNEIGTENIGAGDLLIPFAKVAAEVKQVGIDYTGSGMITGMSEMIGIIKDAKAGKEIDPYRQRKAATDFGRGITGVALTALFTAMAFVGAIKVHNDRDSEERTMDQSQGLSGAQWNLGSAIRWLEAVDKGATEEEALEAAKWQHGDELTTVDFLEPFNTQMHIGYLISQGESIPVAVLKGNLEALLEMPMMQAFSDLADIQQAFSEISEGDMSGVLDATGQLVGTVAGAAIPNFARKAAQVIDPYYRDTYDTDPLKKAGKELVAGIPGASMLLPKKYDNLGQEQRRYEDGEGFAETIDALITPWDTKTYQTNPVYQEVERLNAALSESGINVTPPQPKRKISYTDNAGGKRDGYTLTSEEYETMAKTQGQTAADILNSLVKNSDYKKLTDQQKAYTISAVYEYAQEAGKKAALPGYHSSADAWISETKAYDQKAFITQGTKKALNNAIGNAVSYVSNGWKVTEAAKKDIEQSYTSYSKLSAEQKERVKEQIAGDTLKYLEVREKGATTQNYLDAVQNVKKLGEDPKAADKYEAIAGTTGTSDSVKDALIKAYMPDYDPEKGNPDTTELKYDYARQKMGLSPNEYADAYRVTTEGGKKAEKLAKWKSMGYTDAECTLLWNLFETNGSQKIDVVKWYESKNKE